MQTLKNTEEKKNKKLQVKQRRTRECHWDRACPFACVHNSSESSSSRFQVQITRRPLEAQDLNWLTCRDTGTYGGDKMASSDVWNRSSSQIWRWMDMWKNVPAGREKSEEEGKESQHSWRRQEGLRESSSCGRWTNRQYERKDATRRLWAPVKGSIERRGLSGQEVAAMELLLTESAEAQMGQGRS